MLTIVYASVAVRAMTDDDLAGLLADARGRNERAGVTGMLLYAQDSFLQQLEGEDDAVTDTFARIESDARHTDVRVLSRRTIEDRRFGRWAMGYDHPDAARLGGELAGFASVSGAPLPSFDLVQDAEVAEALLGLSAADGGT